MSHQSNDYHNNDNSTAIILLTVSVLGLALVITDSFGYSYVVFAISKKNVRTINHTNGITTRGSISTSSSAGPTATPNYNVLTEKELSSFISCIKTANKSAEGLTQKVFTNCLDIAKIKTPSLSLLLSLPEQVASH
jgi:hypothetical protein